MTNLDVVVVALTAWRENRGGGTPGMQSVINVICNRATKNRSTPYEECVKPMQFSSLTAKNDPELVLWPARNDPQFNEAFSLAANAANLTLTDITGGAVDYYAPHGISTTVTYRLPNGTTVPFPMRWNPAVVEFTAEIANQLFFKIVV